MRYLFLLLFFQTIFSACRLLGLNSNNFNRLSEYDKSFIQNFELDRIGDTVDYKRFRVKKNFNWDTLKIEQITKLDLEKAFSQNHSTMVYFATPWCSGYDSLTKRVFKCWRNKCGKSDSSIKLIIIHDSYYLGFIQSAMQRENYTQRVYILDNCYGDLIYRNFRVFKTKHLGIRRKYAVKYPVIIFDRKGNVIEFVKDEEIYSK